MESRETMRALPTLQLFRLPSRQSCATRAVLTPQHLGGLEGCHGRNVGKLNAHRQGDDGLTVEKQQRIYAPESENHSKAPPILQSYFARFLISCNPTLQDLPQTICNPRASA